MKYIIVAAAAIWLAFAGNASAQTFDAAKVKDKTYVAATPTEEADLCAAIIGLMTIDAQKSPDLQANKDDPSIKAFLQGLIDASRFWIQRGADSHGMSFRDYGDKILLPNMMAIGDMPRKDAGFYGGPCEQKRQAFLKDESPAMAN